MIAPEERKLLGEYIIACARLSHSFDLSVAAVQHLLPTDETRVDTVEGIDRLAILAFMKSFEQFEDTLQRTIKTVIQVMELGKVERLTGVDIANRGASIGAIENERLFSAAVRTRNKLAHEFPTRPDKRVAQLNEAWVHRATLIDAWRTVRAFVAKEGLQ